MSGEYTQSQHNRSSDEVGLISHEAEQLIGKDMQQANLLLEKGLKLNEKDPKLNKVAAYYFHYLRRYELAIHYASCSLQYIKEFSREYYNIKKITSDALFFLADSYYYQAQFNSSEKAFQYIITSNMQSTDLFTLDQVKQKLQFIEQIRTKSIKESTQLNIQESQKEALELLQKIQECEKNQYMKQHGMPVLVIPKKWFTAWQKYVKYSEVLELQNDKTANGSNKSRQKEGEDKRSRKNSKTSSKENDDDDNHGNLKINNSKTQKKPNGFQVEETAFQLRYPGPIDSADILETYPILSANLATDPDKVKQFSNLVLKKDLQENEDFVLFPAPVGKILFDKYGGVRVKRLILSIQDDTQITQVEIYPMRIDFLVIPNYSSNLHDQIVYKTYINKKETVANLKQKIFRILQAKSGNINIISPTICKLWRCDNQLNLKQLIKGYENRENSQVFINAKLIDNSATPLDEAEIAEYDLIVVEYKGFQNEWVLQNESEKLVVNICGECGKKDNDLYYCECQLIRYCNYDCQKKHRPKHRNLCQQTKDELRSKKEILDKFKIKTDRKQNEKAVNGVCGLQNLGNTCFMNSSLQCLSNVLDLTDFMLQDKFIHDLNRDNPLGTGGFLAASYAELIKDMWRGSNSYAQPWNLKKIIGKFAPQFSGYSQQDSHELLSYLLDGIHEDLNRVKKKPIVNQIESDGQNDLEVALKSWENYLKRNRSIIVDLMVGQFKSTLNCPSCNKISVTFDPYMAISVPVPSIAITCVNVYIQTRNQSQLILTQYYLKGQDTVRDLKEQISKEYNIDADNIDVFQQQHKLQDTTQYTDDVTIDQLNNNKDLLFAYEKLSNKYDRDVPTDINKQVYFKMSIIIKNKRDKQFESASYQRIFYIGQNTSYETIHIKAWQIYRQYIAKFVNNNEEVTTFQVNLEQDDMEYLLEEYKRFRQFSESNKLSYDLKLENQYEVEFEKDKSLATTFEQISKKNETIELSLSLVTQLQEIPQINSYDEKNKPKNEYTLYDCLDLFISKEVLDKGNEWYCNVCKQHKQATKRMEIFETPKILIVHIKRFRTNRVSSIGNFYFQSGGQKLDDYISFPVNGLDMSKYVLSHQYKQGNEPLLYDLFAVSNHYGSMSGGHYTAYGKNPTFNRWFDFNDSSVSEASQKDVVSRAAYVLFYKKREKANIQY